MDMFDDEAGSPPTEQLPIVDYNHLSGRTAESHFPSLGPDELADLLRYERAHRNRLPIIRSLTARLRRLRHEQDEETSRTGGYGPPLVVSRPDDAD
ncbi:hypothetical protein [Actinacidiphila paucisporea]|uniref:DUF8129 domain-containing protein n=1 Tax=Actinacidiphila paucisporea TaxID=310782 RepID=A0A1M7P7P2_9ACTN|nr:hypothetical protein [Actinacidiphila paucisporea]SHN12738.1 hypothetical protein SAMN05216499_121119 [Actinacidiphila paucisporea]